MCVQKYMSSLFSSALVYSYVSVVVSVHCSPPQQLSIKCCRYYACLHVSYRSLIITYVHTVTLTSSADILCPGDTVVFTCVTTDTGRLVWEITHNNIKQSFYSPAQINIPVNMDIFTLTLLNVTNSNTYQSTAVAHNVSVDYNGAKVSCSDDIELSSKLSAIIGM